MQTIENYILKTGGTKKALKELTGTKNWIVKMKDDRGKFDHHRIDILKPATSYYKKLYQNNTTQAEINLVETSNTPSILQAEVSKAIVKHSILYNMTKYGRRYLNKELSTSTFD